MSQGDQFHQYGYNHYLKAPQKKASYGAGSYDMEDSSLSRFLGRVGGSGFLQKLQSPIVAGTVLAGAVALFVGVIAMTYPSGDDVNVAIPVIKADLGNIKQYSSSPSGMSIPHKDSTVLARADQPSIEQEVKRVENLLARDSQQDLISKEKAINLAMQKHPLNSDVTEAGIDKELAALHAQSEGAVDMLLNEVAKSTDGQANEQKVANIYSSSTDGDVQILNTTPVLKIEEPDASDILQKIGSSRNSNDDGVKAQEHDGVFVGKVAVAALSKKPAAPAIAVATAAKPAQITLHRAGQSPETIEFVRSVLGERQDDSAAKRVQAIEPAVGAASTAIEVTAGSYFVQLASITDAKRAPSEWSKMQVKYDVLNSSNFRVQEASLSSGTFYRIQAGPMSKSSATEICDALKRANKPGGCLVIK